MGRILCSGVAPTVTAIPLGRRSPARLDAIYPRTPRARSTSAYLMLLHAEIARFTRTESARLCCSDPRLRALRRPAGRCYLLRCPVQSGPSSSAPFRATRQRRSGLLHGGDYRRCIRGPICVLKRTRGPRGRTCAASAQQFARPDPAHGNRTGIWSTENVIPRFNTKPRSKARPGAPRKST